MGRPKQEQIPGTEQPRVKDVEQAAERYIDVRDKRMALTEKEVTAHASLLEAMHRHGLESYRYDDMIVTVKHGAEKVRVRTAGAGLTTAPSAGFSVTR